MESDMKKAPTGQFRVIGQDDPRDTGWKKGDYPTLSEAKRVAKQSAIRFSVYDDKGQCVVPRGNA